MVLVKGRHLFKGQDRGGGWGGWGDIVLCKEETVREV